LDESVTAQASGSIRIADGNADSFSETISFLGNQTLTGVQPLSDPLGGYIGTNTNAARPRAKSCSETCN